MSTGYETVMHGPDDVERPARLPGELRHPRLVGGVFVAVAIGCLTFLVALVRNEPAEPGRYGQMVLTMGDPYRFPVVSFVVLLGVGVTGAAMLVRRRPANRTVVWILTACVVSLVVALVTTGRTEVFSAGVGCMKPYTRDEVRASWADRPTVGEVLTGGLLQGNVADGWIFSAILDKDPDAGGCPGL